MKKYFVLLFSMILSSCVTPMKAVDPAFVFDTGIGFKLQPPPNGPWYEMKTQDVTGYVLGREPSAQDKQDGTTVIADVRFGFINLDGLKLKKKNDIFKFFENSMKDKSNTDRFESSRSQFDLTKLKGAECMKFDQLGTNDKVTKSPKGEMMIMSMRGLMCLHPKDKGRYVRLTLSQRVPASREFYDLKKDEFDFYDSLVFSDLAGHP